MPTIGDVVTRALRKIGVVPEEEDPSNVDMAEGIARTNALLSSWSLDGTNLFTKKRRTHQLVAARSSTNPYSIGPNAADFNVPRPILFETANCILAGTSFRSDVSILNSKQWAAIRDLGMTAFVPDKVYLDGDYLTADGRSSLYVHPIPTSDPLLEIIGWEAFLRFTLSTDPFLFPDGYERAIEAALAIESIPDYPAGQRSQETIQSLLAIAQNAKALIQNANQQTLGLALSEAVTLKGASQGLPMGAAPPSQ